MLLRPGDMHCPFTFYRSAGMNAQDETIIRGYVRALPTVRGREETARVAVVTDDGTEYRIPHKGTGIPLAANINANVEVTGQIVFPETPHSEETETESCVLTVKSYRLIDGFDDPWYDDEVT